MRLLITDDRRDQRRGGELTADMRLALTRVAEYALEYEECDFDAEVSVTITDNEGIHEINKDFRGIDRPTDVLSFPMLEFDEEGNASEDYEECEDGAVMLGDIVISLERAKEQAAEYGHSMLREVAFLAAHSMLHLLGYDHVQSEEDAAVMFKKQEEILAHLEYTRDK